MRVSEDYQIVLSILIEQRARKTMTQAQVARALNRPQSFVSKYERAERRLDFAETIALCTVLEIDPRHLLSEFLNRRASTSA